MSTALPLILILRLHDLEIFTPRNGHLLSNLLDVAEIIDVDDPEAARRHLTSTTRPFAVIVADAALTRPQFRDILLLLVDYVKQGGAAVFAGLFPSAVLLPDLDFMLKDAWGLQWRSGTFKRDEFFFNRNNWGRCADLIQLHYTMKALTLTNVPAGDVFYSQTRIGKNKGKGKGKQKATQPSPESSTSATYEAAAAVARVGRGTVGFIGDLHSQHDTTWTICTMFFGVERDTVRPPGAGVPARNKPNGLASASASSAAVDGSEEQPTKGNPGKRRKNGNGTQKLPPNVWDPEAAERAVATRAAFHEKIKKEKQDKADVLRDAGNDMFKKGQWAEAAENYRKAALLAGPHPVYLSNLAVCLLKLKLWEAADSAASRALLHDPKHVKSLYRRALARTQLNRLNAAETDILRLLQMEPTNAPARVEQEHLRDMQSEGEGVSWWYDVDTPDGNAREPDEPLDVDYECESDSEDFRHAGNGTPCRFYNRAREGCKNGARCKFSHAPDSRSVRDKLGRNVCLYWLLGRCAFDTAKHNNCAYSHHANYLPERGWWTDERRLTRIRKEFNDAVAAHPLPPPYAGPREYILAEALKPASWHRDLWAAMGPYEDEAACARARREEAEAEKGETEGQDDISAEEQAWEDEQSERIVEDALLFVEDCEERTMNYGPTEEDVEDMMLYGIRPYEEGAYESLLAVRHALSEHF